MYEMRKSDTHCETEGIQRKGYKECTYIYNNITRGSMYLIYLCKNVLFKIIGN